MRKFDTGATRDDDATKLDYEGFLSPIVLERYAQYMHKHRKQANGELRDSDNWQKGIPIQAYLKSLIRHVMELWKAHRWIKDEGYRPDVEDILCAIVFNAMGLLFELLSKHVAPPIPKFHTNIQEHDRVEEGFYERKECGR